MSYKVSLGVSLSNSRKKKDSGYVGTQKMRRKMFLYKNIVLRDRFPAPVSEVRTFVQENKKVVFVELRVKT